MPNLRYVVAIYSTIENYFVFYNHFQVQKVNNSLSNDMNNLSS